MFFPFILMQFVRENERKTMILQNFKTSGHNLVCAKMQNSTKHILIFKGYLQEGLSKKTHYGIHLNHVLFQIDIFKTIHPQGCISACFQ